MIQTKKIRAMKRLAFTLIAVFGLAFVSAAQTSDVERPIKKALTQEKFSGKTKAPQRLKAHTHEKPVLKQRSKKPLKRCVRENKINFSK